MSSQADPQLLNLAPEIVENIIKQVRNKKDLSNVRLACKTLDKLAVTELFKDVFISPSDQDINPWNSISQNDIIRQMPRHVIIHTQPDVTDTDYGEEREREEIGEDFESALAAMVRFTNVDSVEISFTPDCVGEQRDYWQDVAEDIGQRKDILKQIFQAIKDRTANEKNRPIRKLTIINLQNCPLPDFTSSELFRDVMEQLEELHVSFIQECNEHGPDHDYTKIELQTFPAYFCSHWLQPISANLKSLSIYHKSDNWGPFPGYFNPSGIDFPSLETLALGYYTIAHDKDIEWVLAIKSLKKLVLHNCMIASWMRIDSDNMAAWKVQTHDWTNMVNDEEDSWGEQFAYGGKWNQFLNRIAEELPHLVDFRFDNGDTYSSIEDTRYGLANRDRCGAIIYPERYVCFDNGILPTHWIEAEEDGEMESWLEDGFPTNMHEENLEADQKSLERLLNKLTSLPR